MESACDFLFDTLQQNEPTEALQKLQTADRSRDDPFSLSEVLAFLPERRQGDLATLLSNALCPSFQNFSSSAPLVNVTHEKIIDIASHITWLLVRERKRTPVEPLRLLIISFHNILLNLPVGKSQNTIANLCEWLWSTNDPQRHAAIPYVVLYLLMRSFKDETYLINSGPTSEQPPKSKSATVSVIRRVYALRKAFAEIDLAEGRPGSRVIRTFLLRCATSQIYLNEGEGRKFIAHILTLDDIRDAMLDSLINQLSIVRKSHAKLFGDVFLQAWTKNRSDWLANRLIFVAERAILAARDPFACNLRIVLASFHLNKRLNGVDVLLHRIYTPTLFGNLFVANPNVRKNAVTILADAYPIHDPGSPRDEIEAALEMQTTHLLDLLTDEAPVVRIAAVQGACRALGTLWGIMPPITARKMIDVLTTKLAADNSSARVRATVFRGLSFLMQNQFIHPILAIVLPRLRRLIHDPVENVRLGMLDLLHTIKGQRLRSLRYFDVVPVDELITLLATESSMVALRVLKLIVTSHFPLVKENYTQEQIVATQIKACLSMLKKNPQAARFFYRHVNLYVPPGPLCEFALRLSELAFDARSQQSSKSSRGRSRSKTVRAKSCQTRRRGRSRTIENDAEVDEEEVEEEGDQEEERSETNDNVSKETLLTTIADILESIQPSLEKEKNAELRLFKDDIFSGNALRPHLIDSQRNSMAARAACWRIASCVSVTHMRTIRVLWREQMDTVVEWCRDTVKDAATYRELLAALVVTALRWNVIPSLLAVVSGWADGAAHGRRGARVGTTKAKRKASRRTPQQEENAMELGDEGMRSLLDGRQGNVYALHALAAILTNDDPDGTDVCSELYTAIARSGISCNNNNNMDEEDEEGNESVNNNNEMESPPGRLVSCMRKGVLGAMDHLLERLPDNATVTSVPDFALVIRALASTLKACISLALRREAGAGAETELSDVRDIVHWLCSPDLWTQLARVHPLFTAAITATCAGPFADTVALQRFGAHDAELLHQGFCKAADVLQECTDMRLPVRAAVEMLRVGVLLDEHARAGIEKEEEIDNDDNGEADDALSIAMNENLNVNELEGEENNNSMNNNLRYSTRLRRSIIAQQKHGKDNHMKKQMVSSPMGQFTKMKSFARKIIGCAFRSLRGIVIDEEEQQTGQSFRATDVQMLIMRGLVHTAQNKDDKDYISELSGTLRAQFRDENVVDGGFIATTLCTGIRMILTEMNKTWKGVDDALGIFELVWNALLDEKNNDGTSNDDINVAVITFVMALCKALINFYNIHRQDAQQNEDEEENEHEENGTNNDSSHHLKTKPSSDVIVFFTHVKDTLDKRLPHEEPVGDEIAQQVEQVRQMLDSIRHMREEAVLNNSSSIVVD